MAEEASYKPKQYAEWTGEAAMYLGGLAGVKDKSQTLEQVARNYSGLEDAAPSQSAGTLLSLPGLGGLTVNEILSKVSGDHPDIAFLEQHGLGKGVSTVDYVKRYAAADPFFDPNDEASVSAIAKDIEDRGLNPQKDVEQIQRYIVNKGMLNTVDKAQYPEKYLDDDKKAANLETAKRLQRQAFGDDYVDEDEAGFLAKLIAEGEDPYEVMQFIKTTPQYIKKQSDAENLRVQEESAAARQALDQELLKSQQEMFEKATPSIIASYMRAGRLNSSGLQNALVKAQQDLERERQGFLANAAYNDSIRAQGYRREDFVGANAQAFQQYLRQNEPAYQQRFNVQNAGNYAMYQRPWEDLARTYALNDRARERMYELEDYNRAKSDYERYMMQDRRSSRQNLPWQLVGQLGGAALQGWAMGGFGWPGAAAATAARGSSGSSGYSSGYYPLTGTA